MIEIIPDRILFVMPEDRELQFCAMSSMQCFVQTYADRMKVHNLAGPEKYKFELHYQVEIDPDHWKFFQRIGLEIRVLPERLTARPDMIIDMSDERLLKHKDSGMHACQWCNVMSGVPTPVIPAIRRVKPSLSVDRVWRSVDGMTAPEDLVDGEVSGVYGYASWKTYLTCSMGIPTVEIIPYNRHVMWLSKFTNSGYRVIREDDDNLWFSMLTKAEVSIERELDWFRMKIEESKKNVSNLQHQ